MRYTGNWKGSMEGWLITPKTGIKALPAELPGLRNFYMVGQWLSPGGGLPSGPLTARPVAKKNPPRIQPQVESRLENLS